MKKSLKQVLCLITAIVVLASMAGCGSSTPSTTSTDNAASPAATPTAQASKEVKTLSMLMYTDWYKAGWQALEKNINDNSADLGFKLEISKIQGGAQGDQVIKTKFAANDLPDILEYYKPRWIEANTGDLTKLVDMTGIKSASEYDSKTLDGVYNYKGKLLGMPIDSCQLSGILYNKKVFQKLGVSVPKNWNDFMAICDKAKAAGITPLFMSGKDGWTLQLFPLAGFSKDVVKSGKNVSAYMDDVNANKTHFADGKNFMDLMQKNKDLISKGYVNKTYMSESYANAEQAIANGTAAMYCNATWTMDDIVSKFPDKADDVGAFALPFEDGDNYTNLFLPFTIGVTTSCKDIDTAKKAIDYIESSKAQQVYATAQPGIYLNKNVNVKLPGANADLKAVMDSGKAVIDFEDLVNNSYGDFGTYMAKFYVDAKRTTQDVAKDMDTETAKSAKAKNDPNWK